MSMLNPTLNLSTNNPLPPELMSDTYIQEELKTAAALRTIQENQKVVLEIPSLSIIAQPFESFCANRISSALLFSTHPYFRQKFEHEDLKTLYSFERREQKYTYNMYILFTLIFGIGGDYLERVRPIFGLTCLSVGKSFFLRFVIIPKIFSNVIDHYVFSPYFNKSTDNILKKYDYYSELETNPLYKKAYEDFIKYDLSTRNTNNEQKQQQES